MEKRRKIVKWLAYIFGTFLGLILLFLLLLFLFEDKIKAYAVERLNQNLNTEIKVSQIELSFWHSFPYAALDFNDVLILDPETVNKEKDTMLYAKRLSLEFSIWDIFSGNYKVKEVIIQAAQIHLYIDEKGNENYRFWKASKEKGDDKFQFELEKLQLNSSVITYKNKINGSDYSFHTDKTTLKGNFSEKDFTLEADAGLFVNHFRSGKITLLRKKKSNLKVGINVDLKNEKLTILKGRLAIEDLILWTDGVVGIGDTTTLDLKVKSNEVELEDIYRIFPKKFSEKLMHYSSQGEVKVNANINGIVSATQSPLIKVNFSVENGKMIEKESKVTLSELYFDGHYTSKNENDAEELVIPKLAGKFLDGSFQAGLSIRNFIDPKLTLQVEGDFNLKTLHQFLRPAKIDAMSGEMHSAIQLQAGFVSEKQTMDIVSAYGMAKVKNATFTSKELNMDLTSLKGKIEINNKDASIEALSGKKGESDFEINGVIKNFMPYALKENQHINIVASLVSKKIRLEDFLFAGVVDEKSERKPYSFPDKINFNLDAQIEQLSYGTFEAKKISGNFKLLDKIFTAKKLRLNMADGNCKGDLTVDGTVANGFLIETHQKLSDIKINELFTLFENFGQASITEKNLEGRLNSTIDFVCFMDNHLNLETKNLISTVQLELKDGVLKDFILLNEVITYLKDDKVYATLIGKKNLARLDKEVRNIRFSTLSNTLVIKNEEILIPEMKVESSALNFNLYGSHQFDNDIDYHINFRFKDLKLDKTQLDAENMVDNDKGLKLYLQIDGNLNNPQYHFDKKEFKADLKEKLQEEKNTLKSVLKTELGMFKKDTTVKQVVTPKEEVKFLFEWDEDNNVKEDMDTEEKKEKERKRVKKQKEKNSVNTPQEKVKFSFDDE